MGRRPQMLTTRELEVLTLVANGKTASQIAEFLKVAKRTVDAHMQSTIRKLGVKNSSHAVAVAITNGLIKLK